VDGVLCRVLDALLREDYRGLRTGGIPVAVPELDGGTWLAAPGALLFPVRPGVGSDWSVRRPVLASGEPPVPLTGLVDVLAALRPPPGDADAAAGFARFEDECWQAVAVAQLAGHNGAAAPQPGSGLAGSLAYERLASFLEHPVYPTGRARVGLTAASLRRYAPEFGPVFRPRWLALPAGVVRAGGEPPDWWPDRAGRHVLPVHPLTVGLLPTVLREAGLADRAELLPPAAADPEVTPTLSMRTVALTADPATHLKLPLPASTLGARNRRSLVPGTLADGARVHELLAAILAHEPAYARRVLLADESCHAHAGHEYLGYLVRRYPADLGGATVVPLAALPARLPDGRTVAEQVGFDLGEYLALLFGWHVTLWLRYGVALESHQQNISLVLGAGPLRLLYKDNDGPRLDHDRLAATLGADAPRRGELTDQRLWVGDPDELAAVFTTITVHLCAGALAFALADRGVLDLATALAGIRDRLATAAAEHEGEPAAATLRRLVLDADRLPVKTMVTAGTLLPKHRTGAADINKHYGTTGPNYLLPHPPAACRRT
jgi:hypothetical protein